MAKSAPVWAVQSAPDETKLKEEFAELLLRRPDEAMECAKIVTPQNDDHFALSFVRSRNWPYDPYVKAHQKKLLEQFGDEYFLPSKAELVHHWWARIRARGENGYLMEDRDGIAATRLISEMRHFVGKFGDSGEGGGNSVNNTVVLQFVKPDESPPQAKTTVINSTDYKELAPLNIEFKE